MRVSGEGRRLLKRTGGERWACLGPLDIQQASSPDVAFCLRPRVLHLARCSTLQQCNVTTGIICLLAGSGEDILEIEAKLDAGENEARQVISLIRSYAGGDHRGSSSVYRAELVYDGHLLMSLDCQLRSGSWTPFPGGNLLDDRFVVREHVLTPGFAQRQYLVVVQQPEYSMLELCVNALVPSDLEDVARTYADCNGQGICAPLLAMDGGWAVGGQLASRVLRLSRDSLLAGREQLRNLK